MAHPPHIWEYGMCAPGGQELALIIWLVCRGEKETHSFPLIGLGKFPNGR